MIRERIRTSPRYT